MFEKILIANRGEIALRILRACREMGIQTVAVHSTADANAMHVKLADESVCIGPPRAKDSYLNIPALISAATITGADAIHPGIGFLSENAHFAEVVIDHGLAFIGPKPEHINLMGNKITAKDAVIKLGIPTVPGSSGSVEHEEDALKIAESIGYPLLIKAAGGGGGKGMQVARSPESLKECLYLARNEAEANFGNSEVYIEKYLDHPRHIEVQIIADKYGNYRHLFERECSIQRRHQKIIEEAPSSFVDEETRAKLTTAAINAAKTCNYFNAGTIEFLMDSKKNYYFLEMNTRLQVEHPVTELISGIDLVKEQISIAKGNEISFKQEDVKITGHSIECRIYAEDVRNNFMPSTGTLTEHSAPAGPGVRLDTGFKKGSQISIYYDPMIAKLVLWAPDRKTAIDRTLRALGEYQISGVITNIYFLKKVIESKLFISGNFDITYIDKEINNLIKKSDDQTLMRDEDAAVIISALLKNQKSSSSDHKLFHEKNNRWEDNKFE